MTVVNRRRLEATHHKWLHVSCHDKITNKSIRERTGQEDMQNTNRKRRLKWLGHLCRMENDRRANQALHWAPEGRKRRARTG